MSNRPPLPTAEDVFRACRAYFRACWAEHQGSTERAVLARTRDTPFPDIAELPSIPGHPGRPPILMDSMLHEAASAAFEEEIHAACSIPVLHWGEEASLAERALPASGTYIIIEDDPVEGSAQFRAHGELYCATISVYLRVPQSRKDRLLAVAAMGARGFMWFTLIDRFKLLESHTPALGIGTVITTVWATEIPSMAVVGVEPPVSRESGVLVSNLYSPKGAELMLRLHEGLLKVDPGRRWSIYNVGGGAPATLAVTTLGVDVTIRGRSAMHGFDVTSTIIAIRSGAVVGDFEGNRWTWLEAVAFLERPIEPHDLPFGRHIVAKTEELYRIAVQANHLASG